jgi:hypothetical protein
MQISLSEATVESLVDALFGHDVPTGDVEPWYFAIRVCFEIDPRRQLKLIAELFHNAGSLLSSYSAAEVEQGLWCMLGGAHSESFTGLVWSAALPFGDRSEVIASVFDLYDQVLAPYPFEGIDFRHPDASPRRFRTIDYMAPDLLLEQPYLPKADAADEARVRETFLGLFARLLTHPAAVARYAALHGLGHLEHQDRAATIDRFLADHSCLESDQREYAFSARRGEVL